MQCLMSSPIDLLPGLLQRISFVSIKLLYGLLDLLLVLQDSCQHLRQRYFLLLDTVYQ